MGVNMKTVVTTPDICEQPQNSSRFVTLPQYMDYFQALGINYASLANNHTYLCGAK